VVDSRRTVGSWFFGAALVVFIGSSVRIPAVQFGFTLLWAVLALAVVVDSVFISRKIARLVRERYPKTTQRMGSLYLYASMRALTFRGLRVPKPRVKVGDKV